jgi:uncharacterized protein
MLSKRFITRITILTLFLIICLNHSLGQSENPDSLKVQERAIEDSDTIRVPSILFSKEIGLSYQISEAIKTAPIGSKPGEINLEVEKGFAGIPGAPKINIIVVLLWAIWVGWVFSTVGALGGVMACFGHFSLFGIGNYSASFKTTAPLYNSALTDTIRSSNAFIVAISALIPTFTALRKTQVIFPIAIILGLGGISGAVCVAWLTAGIISSDLYIGLFGIVTILISIIVLFQILPMGKRNKTEALEEVADFKRHVRANSKNLKKGVSESKFYSGGIKFKFYGMEFKFNPIILFLGGVIIGGLVSFFGIGAGFLIIPFMTTVIGLPTFIVAGASAFSVLVTMIATVGSFIFLKGVYIDWMLLGIESVGVFAGAVIGIRMQKIIPEVIVKILFILIAVYLGIGYISLGFMGDSIVPIF